ARHLGEDGRLLDGEDIGGEGELHLDVAALRRHDAHQWIRPGAGGAARLLGPRPEERETTPDHEKNDDDCSETVASQEVHVLSGAVGRQIIALVAALFYGWPRKSQVRSGIWKP